MVFGFIYYLNFLTSIRRREYQAAWPFIVTLNQAEFLDSYQKITSIITKYCLSYASKDNEAQKLLA
jgi:hypothetical protein